MEDQNIPRYRVTTEENGEDCSKNVGYDKCEDENSNKTYPCLMSLAIFCSDIICMFHHNRPQEHHTYQHIQYKTVMDKLG